MDFSAWPLWLNAAIFCCSAAAVWIAGTRLAMYADVIADKTGLGHALIGMLLLGGITSLPEIVVSMTASISGNPALAVNNLLGSTAFQGVMIAVGDFALRKRALTAVVGTPTVLLQGVFCCLLLCLVIGGITLGDYGFAGIGLWGSAILGLSILFLWIVANSRGREAWLPQDLPALGEIEEHEGQPKTLSKAVLLTIVVAPVIVVAGYLLARTGGALAEQTGLGSSFVGALFVGVSTSLPEISTVLAAVRLRRYLLALSDIFGTNIINIGLIGAIDIAYRDGPVLNEVGSFSVMAAVLGIVVILLYVAGLIERRDRAVGPFGIDSIAVIACWLGGIAVLYTLR